MRQVVVLINYELIIMAVILSFLVCRIWKCCGLENKH